MASSRIYSECGGVSCVRECLIHVAEIIAHDCDLCLFVVCWRVVMLGWAGAMFCGVCVCRDDLGYGDVGFLGNTTIRTPNLDKLASQVWYACTACAWSCRVCYGLTAVCL